jgi:hypothetical protein
MIKIKIDLDIVKEYEKELAKQTSAEMERILDRLVEATPIDTGEARAGWEINGNSIENHVEHVKDLNRGTSQQAPIRFIEKTLLSHPGVRPRGTIVRST